MLWKNEIKLVNNNNNKDKKKSKRNTFPRDAKSKGNGNIIMPIVKCHKAVLVRSIK